MAGILDQKQRILDTIITKEGRRQIADGELRIRYVTFTDRHTFYTESDRGDGSVESADGRLFFEATNRPQDQIIFETDNDTKMLPFAGNDIKIGYNGKLYKDIVGSSTPNEELIPAEISVTAELIDELLEGSAQNFRDQKIIGTLDRLSETSSFTITPNYTQFAITNSTPFTPGEITEASITKVESLHEDKRLQHLPFYKYLPPINQEKPGQDEGEPLGVYAKLNQPEVMTINELEMQLVNREVIELEFSETSQHNNIIMQFLETGIGEIEKLSMIDFGEFPSDDPYSPGKRVFFVGKIFTDDDGMSTYVNIFTVILE